MPPTSPTPVNRDEAPARERGPLRRDRGDACPGALRLHVADDGRLARLRLPAGLLTFRQAEVLASAAERLGDGHLDITSRGNVQLRGLGESCGGELARLLHEAGLLPSEEHERVRNIVASPLAGLDRAPARIPAGTSAAEPTEIPSADVQLWARELDRLLCASPAATALSGRFLFALDDGRGDVAALGADVTLLAQADGSATVRTGTNRSGPTVAASDAPRAALLAAETFLTVAAGSGAWRVRELPDGHGLDDAVASALAAITKAAVTTAAPAADAPPAVPAASPPPPGLIRSPADGTTAVSVLAPLGRLDVAQWRLLSDVRTTRDELRFTPWRGVVIPGLAPEAAADLLARLRAAGLITATDSPWYGVSACTGRPGCAKALSDVRSDATPHRRQSPHGDLPVHWSGCARRCGHPTGQSWVDVVATGEGSYQTRRQSQ